MKIIDDIMDAMGIIDEVEEEDIPRKPREEKKTNRFAKPEAKTEKVDLDDEDDLEEMTTKEKITSLFTRKKNVAEPEAEKAPVASAVEEKAEPTKRRLNFNFTKKAEAEVAAPEEARPAAPAKPMPRRAPFPTALGEVNMQMLEPVSFDDSQKVADALHNSQPVVVNFENTDPIIAKRMTDFISGVIYALQGNMKKIGRNILICAPKNVDIDSGLGNEYRGEDSWR